MNIGYYVMDKSPKEFDDFCDKIAQEYIEISKQTDNKEIYSKSQKHKIETSDFNKYVIYR